MATLDPATMKMLTEQLGLAEGSVGPELPDLASLVADRIAPEAPDSLRMLLTSALRQRAEEAEQPDDAELRDDALDRARATVRELKRHLADADAMIAHVAEAFGACPVCWGGSELCQRCHGQGRPGSSAPLEEELMAWVVPALDRLGLTVVRKAN